MVMNLCTIGSSCSVSDGFICRKDPRMLLARIHLCARLPATFEDSDTDVAEIPSGQCRMLLTRLFSGAASSAVADPSSAISPTATLSQQYALEVHTLSYDEIWSKIHEEYVHVINPEQELVSRLYFLLEPNRDGVEEALCFSVFLSPHPACFRVLRS